jgi:hypothetical protein
MKRALAISFLFLCCVCHGQLVVTNNLIGTMDASSYDTVNSTTASGYAGYLMGYLKAAFDNIYPQCTNLWLSSGSGGANMETQITNDVPKLCPAVWAFATSNKVVPINLVLVNDNGGYGSNEVYSFGTNYVSAPLSLYNGAHYTNEGMNLTVQHFMLGANVGSLGNSDTAASSRNLGSIQVMKQLGLTPIDLWHDAGTNGLFSVDLTTDSDFYFAGGHLTPKNGWQHMVAIWRGLGLKTNLYASTLDYSTASIASSNGIAITSLTKAGNTLSWNFKVDCMGPSQDILPAISNQVSTALWSNCPAFGNVFQEIVRFTNLNAGATYAYSIDSVPVIIANGATFMAGINMATNTVSNNPFNTQKTLVLYDIRDEYGVNHTNGLATHSAGTVLGSGPDLINYGSDMFGAWPTLHGPSLVNATQTQTDINSMWARAIVTHNDAQQTTHAGSLAQIVPRYAPVHR